MSTPERLTTQAGVVSFVGKGLASAPADFVAQIYVEALGSVSPRPAADLRIVAAGVSFGTVTSAPLTVAAGAGNGVDAQVVAPVFSAGTLHVNGAILTVSNGAGTEKLTVSAHVPIALTSGQVLTVSFAFGSVLEGIGSDLNLAADNLSVESTAGGQYVAELIVALAGVDLKP